MEGILYPGIQGMLGGEGIDPRTLGILQAGLGIMAAGPGRSLGQAIGMGGMQGLQGYQHARQQQQQDAMFQMKISELQRQQEERARQLKAMQDLVQSRPELKGLLDLNPKGVTEALAKQLTENPFGKIEPKDYTPESLLKFRMTRNQADLVPVRKMDVGPAGQVYDPYTVKPGSVLQDPNKPFSLGTDGAPTPNLPYQNYELNRALAGSTRVATNVNAYTPASEEAQKKFMDATRTNFERLRDAPTQLQNIEKAKQLIGPSSPFVGSFADTKRGIVQFFNNNLGTSIAEDAVASSGELRTRVFQNIMDNLKKMDAQPSQLQQQIMMDALGNLNEDPKALGRMLDAYADVIRNKVATHNAEAESGISRGVKFPYDPLIRVEQPKPSEGQVFDKMPPAAQHKGKRLKDRDTGKFYRSDGMSWRPED